MNDKERKKKEALLQILQKGVKDEVYSLNKEANKRKIEKLKNEIEECHKLSK
ncbi:MAG: hypothetical protein ACRCWY_01000 [Cellulosilyticaceae bacterium]